MARDIRMVFHVAFLRPLSMPLRTGKSKPSSDVGSASTIPNIACAT